MADELVMLKRMIMDSLVGREVSTKRPNGR
jgi:hypothetical protein